MEGAGQTLDVSAFKHVVVPIGVIIGLGVARVVMSVSEYIQQRDRIAFSFTHLLWTTILFLIFVGLWWILWGLRHIEADRWSFFTLIYLLVGPTLLYLPSILLLPGVPDTGRLDLASVFDRVGRPIFLCLALFGLWLVCAEVYLLREPLLVPKRINQGAIIVVAAAAAALPSRRMATGAGLTILILLAVNLATIRSRLA